MALGLAVQGIGLAVGGDEDRQGGGAHHPHLRHGERPQGPDVLRRDRGVVAPGQGEKHSPADSPDADRSPIDLLCQRAEMAAAITAALDPDPLAGGPSELLDHGGRDRLLG